MRRALVSSVRLPEIDRDSGSQQVDLYIRWLREAGWAVTFLARDSDGEEHHARRLRQLGVETVIGFQHAGEVVAAQRPALALLAYWEPAADLLPVIRSASPRTRIVVDSVDVHFLREARRAAGAAMPLDERYGARVAGELNVYRAADAVITPSGKELALLESFLGPASLYELPLAKPVTRSEVPFESRRGMLFTGNFRHLPNGEAVEFLCREVLPLMDRDLLAEHPLSVVGSRLGDKVREHARGVDGVKMIGWVPVLAPYLEHACVSVAPLLHGAGIKGKIVESMMAGTPVVTTQIGAEGMDLEQGRHALIAEGAEDIAAALTRLLTDGRYWQEVADAGAELAHARHGPPVVGERFVEIVEEVLTARPAHAPSAAEDRGRRRERGYRRMVVAVQEALRTVTEPRSTVLVVSRGDDALVAVEDRQAWHFPQEEDGRWIGYHPADGREALDHLERMRRAGARYLVLPATSFWWLERYPELAADLEERAHVVFSSDRLVVFDLEGVPAWETEAGTIRVLGTYAGDEPRPEVVAALQATSRYTVEQSWTAEGAAPAELPATAEEPLWTIHTTDRVTLPEGWLEGFLAVAEQLARAGVQRLQPTHDQGPDAGPPVTERMPGVVAREVEAPTPLPLMAIRRRASATGPVALVDACPIGLDEPPAEAEDPLGYSDVCEVFVADAGGVRRTVRRSQGSSEPLVSVLIATHARPDLLHRCLESFARQTLAPGDFEVVVVDDGSPGEETAAVLREHAGRLPLTRARMDHAGRSAAKNLALLLARGEIVLWFDDDDEAAPDLLETHLRAHEQNPDERTAVLGHTEWAPDLEPSVLMTYLTDVDKLLFSYGNLEPGARRDWRCFWEGRVSSKRSLHVREALHDSRLVYSIDVEMAWRLARTGMEVVYEPAARSFMTRPIDFEGFCKRSEGKGGAQAIIGALHDDAELRRYVNVEGAQERWREAEPELPALVERIAELEAEVAGVPPSERDGDERCVELYRSYRRAFQAYTAKGITEALADRPRWTRDASRPRTPPRSRPRAMNGGGPVLSVTMPVWSRTRELADMAAETIERVWDVARVPTEVVVVDNGSPVQVPLRARVHRLQSNRGVASGWNIGIELCQAPVICVLNSDCMVEPGWDEALYEAATTGRRIAFPYTDHCDGEGFRMPDQAGTAGWCFVLTRALYDELGPFDEMFNPAYCEDTDYWHRAWERGVDLSPVPAAHVVHARRTSASERSDWLLTSHRYLYGWKHGVEPMRAPPFYKREIVEYHVRGATAGIAAGG